MVVHGSHEVLLHWSKRHAYMAVSMNCGVLFVTVVTLRALLFGVYVLAPLVFGNSHICMHACMYVHVYVSVYVHVHKPTYVRVSIYLELPTARNLRINLNLQQEAVYHFRTSLAAEAIQSQLMGCVAGTAAGPPKARALWRSGVLQGV